MDEDSLRNWGYYELPVKSHMSLQLMSYDRDTKPFLPSHDHNPAIVPSNGSYHSRDCVATEHPVTDVDLVRDSWINHREKFLHMFLGKPYNPVLAESRSGLHQHMQMIHPSHQQPDLPKETRPGIEEPLAREGGPKLGHAKKRGSNSALKSAKAKKQMKRPSLKENGGTNNSNTNTNANTSINTTTTTNSNNNNSNSNKSAQNAKKNVEVVINGVDMDITGIPIPVCSCTGAPQQCYRWGCGGWQSACCTTTISMYPLPMSTKRRGARIAGRKMSQGAFKKVLEKLAGEGYDFANPIDLRTYWAKHGTNKFVIIR